MINNIKTIVYHRTLCTSATLVLLIKFCKKNKKNFPVAQIYEIYFNNSIFSLGITSIPCM